MNKRTPEEIPVNTAEQGNNATAMHEALKGLLDIMHDMGIDEDTVAIAMESKHCHMHSKEHLDAIRKANAALAEPARNCDVGTPEEQDERFLKFCLSYYKPCIFDDGCEKCPLAKTRAKARCPIAWGQMPYGKKVEGDRG